MNKDLAKLRQSFDGDEGFMSAHQIKKIRGRQRVTPEWAMSDVEVRKVLLRAFPLLKTSQKQADRAGRWLRIIHLYYRVGLTVPQVASEIGATRMATQQVVRSIKFAFKGLRADTGTARSGKRGRPKRKDG
jgi:hypothetical protein